jgi:hypothetical protein
MYLGETKSPGMEFKYVRFNNIVRNTLRESIQIANMVEDVEIYNNTMLNAGLANITYQTSILQIGDNSVVNTYNNILMMPTTGISYGKGVAHLLIVFSNQIWECLWITVFFLIV